MSSTNIPTEPKKNKNSLITETKLEIYHIVKKIRNNILPFIIFTLAVIISLYLDNKLSVKELGLDDKKFVFLLIFTTIFSTYILTSNKILDDVDDNKRLKNSVRKALIALIIAYFAKLDQVISPFFLVLIFSYFSDKDWI